MLTSRGASRWQLTRLTASEIVPLCGTAALAGGLVGIRLAALLAGTGALRDAGIRLPGPVLLSGGGAGTAGGRDVATGTKPAEARTLSYQ